MKTVELYNDGYLLETYNKVESISGKGVSIGSDPIFVLVMEDKNITIDQGLDFIIVSEDMEEDEIEAIKKENTPKYLNLIYGNDTLFMERKIYKYSRSAHNDSLSFIDYDNDQLIKILFVSKRSKDNLHISLITEK